MARADNPFKNILSQYKRLRSKLPNMATEIAINEFKDNFVRGGYRTNTGVVKWKERKHDKSSRAILVKSGRMRRDFANRSNRNYAKAVNKSPYGKVHNDGLPLRGNKLIQQGFTKNGKPKFVRTGQQAKMPERPFMKHNKHIEDEMEKEYFKSVDVILKRS